MALRGSSWREGRWWWAELREGRDKVEIDLVPREN